MYCLWATDERPCALFPVIDRRHMPCHSSAYYPVSHASPVEIIEGFAASAVRYKSAALAHPYILTKGVRNFPIERNLTGGNRQCMRRSCRSRDPPDLEPDVRPQPRATQCNTSLY